MRRVLAACVAVGASAYMIVRTMRSNGNQELHHRQKTPLVPQASATALIHSKNPTEVKKSIAPTIQVISTQSMDHINASLLRFFAAATGVSMMMMIRMRSKRTKRTTKESSEGRREDGTATLNKMHTDDGEISKGGKVKRVSIFDDNVVERVKSSKKVHISRRGSVEFEDAATGDKAYIPHEEVKRVRISRDGEVNITPRHGVNETF